MSGGWLSAARLYLVGCEGHDLIKIGFTCRSVSERITKLQCGSPWYLYEVWSSSVVKKSQAVNGEAAMLVAYDALVSRGEWICAPANLLIEDAKRALSGKHIPKKDALEVFE